ncbi:hypothetical protein [Vibrio campbellii]|uniref:hypothetical protein n=1 Tax=Vibrio campbellii TaxID=680 RepID=UPI001F338FBF|nr:hypothetical protein [Vibrio campbellii]MCE7729623.1 hypothetical protein [Vibrio campbellii]
MPRIRKLEIVAAGIQRNGQPVDKSVLESVVRNFSSDARPPITLGHPEKGADQIAALGRVDNLQVGENAEGKAALFGEMHYSPELEQLEDDKKFEGQSAGIYPLPGKDGEFYLHHLAQLGQLPPAADIKTRDLFELSDDGQGQAFYLFANTGEQKNKQSENPIMEFKDLMKAVKSYSDDEKKELGEALGFKAAAQGDDEPTPDKKKPANKSDGSEGGDVESEEIKAMQNAMADDRREQLTELANNANLGDEMKKTIDSMIKKTPAIELCNTGEDSRFAEIKSLIKAQPEKQPNSGLGIFEEINLSDEGGEKDTFDPTGW